MKEGAVRVLYSSQGSGTGDMARVKRPKKSSPFQLKLNKAGGHRTGALPKNRGWNDRHLPVLDFVVPEEGLEP